MIRLQKLLADCGIGSRRHIEELIKEGRIKVNSQIAKLGDKAEITDKIYIDNKKLNLKQTTDTKVIIYNKPVKELCSRKDKHHKNTVFDNLPTLAVGRWVMVGRLDFNSSGLLLFTNSGELANHLMHPKTNIERVYLVRVFGKLTESQTKKMLKGISIEDKVYKAKSVELHQSSNTNNWYKVKLMQGKNREIRKLFNSQGLTVSKLLRTSYGPVKLPKDLETGNFRYLQNTVIEKLEKL